MATKILPQDLATNKDFTLQELQLGDGAVGTPSLAFSSDPDTGLFLESVGSLDFAVGGVRIFSGASSGLVIRSGVLSAQDGSNGAPGISFLSDQDLGIYRIGADNLGITTSGNLRFDISTSAATLALPLAMSSNKITGLAAATTSGDAMRYDETVRTSGDQSISGVKDFTGQLKGKGTSTNDSASAGYIGEYVESKSSTFTSFPTSGTWGDMGSISLGAGDWDVTVVMTPYYNAATWTHQYLGISPNSGNNGTGLSAGDNNVAEEFGDSLSHPMSVPNYRVSLASTTTYYAKIRATYSAGTPQYAYRISARRVR